MLKSFIISILLLIPFSVTAQFPSFEWAKGFGSSSGDEGHAIVTDVAGNVYVMGSFWLTVDMDPGPGVFNQTSAGQGDIFVSKFDALGNFIWSIQIGNSFSDAARTMNIDNNGNLYLTGHYFATLDFDPGPAVFNMTCSGTGYAAFLLKLDGGGNFVWAKELIETDYGNSGYAVAIAQSGNIYVSGSFKGTGDFDPGPGVFTASSATTTAEDIFISKFDVNGNFTWMKQFSGSSGKVLFSMVLDPFENIYTTGPFYGTCDFDTGPGVFNLVANNTIPGGWSDVFIAKLGTDGNFVFAKQVSGGLDDVGWGIAVDQTGAIFVTGQFAGISDFDPGPGTFNLTAGPISDAFVLKLDNTGNFSWAKQFATVGPASSTSRGFCIALDSQGNIYTTGDFSGGVDFDPDGSSYVLTTTALEDTYISKLNPAGGFIFAAQLAGNTYTECASLRIDIQRNIYMTGVYIGTTDFDPTPAVFNLTSAGSGDVYILKLKEPCLLTTTFTLNITACNTYTLNGQTYTTSGVYTQILVNTAGCDSIITLNLIIGGSNSTSTISACDNYTWEGQTYTTSGVYTRTYTDIYGCDSILILNLTVNYSVATNINATICEGQVYAGHTTSGTYIDTYVASNGCDSVRTLFLTINPKSFSTVNATICEGQVYAGHATSGTYIDTYIAANGCDSIRTLFLSVNPKKNTVVNVSICEGQSYLAGGSLQTISGVYKDTLLTYLGCDSIITTNLTVNSRPVINLGPDLDLCAGSSVTFNPGGVYQSYLWQDLSTQPTFTANTTGNFWVRVTDFNNCSTSDSVNITGIAPLPANFLKPTDSVCPYRHLSIRSLGNYNQYLWSTGSTQKDIIIQSPGLYWLQVMDIKGCVGVDSIKVFSKSCFSGVFFPNTFTPNNDGRNDLFKAMITGNLLTFKLQIFDRYGNLVFQSNDPKQGWDGTFKGQHYSSTVFTWQCFYQLEGKLSSFESGTILLLR